MRAMGRGLLLPHASSGRASVLGRVFRPLEGSGRTCAQPLPRSERHSALGLRRLRLHCTTRSAAPSQGPRFQGALIAIPEAWSPPEKKTKKGGGETIPYPGPLPLFVVPCVL